MTGCAKTMSDCPGRVEIWQIFSTCKTTGQRKNLLEKAAFWQEVKVVCYLPTPLLHAKLITFQVTDNDLADRWSAITRQEGGIAFPNVWFQKISIPPPWVVLLIRPSNLPRISVPEGSSITPPPRNFLFSFSWPQFAAFRDYRPSTA